MKRLIFVILLLGFLGAFVFRGAYLHQCICIVVGGLFGPPVVLYFVASTFISRFRQKPLPENLLREAAIAAAIGASFAFSYLGGKAICAYDMQQIRDYVSQVVPVLDAYRLENGEYPDSLSDISFRSKKPSILQYTRGRNDFQKFSFYYHDPAGMMDGFGFDSDDRKWFYAD